MKLRAWAIWPLYVLAFVSLLVSYSIAHAKGPKHGANNDVGTIHNIGAMNAVLNNREGGGRLAPQMSIAPMVPPTPARDLPGHGSGNGHGHEKSTKYADRDMEFTPSAARRATNARDGEPAAQAGARRQEAGPEAKKTTILPTCI